MIDVLYPLGKENTPAGSRWGNNEIRFSLRSIEKNLNFNRVFIVGQKPGFINNVEFIPYNDNESIPDQNILRKIIRAIESDISDPFLFFNDDHYLLEQFDSVRFPYFYSGDLKSYIKRRGLDGYGRRTKNTMELLRSLNKPILHYDIHTPILYRKQEFIDNVVNRVDWKKTHFYVIKSLYANQVNIQPVATKDYKSMHAPPKECKIYSTNPHVTAAVYRFLYEKFPKKSKFELCDIGQKV